MSRREDPEMAELRRRAEANDAHRTRAAVSIAALGEPDSPGRTVSCQCGMTFEISGFAWDVVRQITTHLDLRGEKVAAEDIHRCTACREKAEAVRRKELAQRDAHVASLVSRVRAAGDLAPDEAMQRNIAWCRNNGYPEAAGAMEQAYAQRRSQASQAPRQGARPGGGRRWEGLDEDIE